MEENLGDDEEGNSIEQSGDDDDGNSGDDEGDLSDDNWGFSSQVVPTENGNSGKSWNFEIFHSYCW